MPKVLFIRSNPVNPDSRVEKEVNSLIQSGYEVDVLGWDREANYALREEKLVLTAGSARCFRVGIKAAYGSGIRNIRNLLSFQNEIHRFLKIHRTEYDIVHACDFDTAFAAFVSVNHKRTKLVYDIFDYYVESMRIPQALKPIIVSLDRYVMNNADAVIICTEQRKEQIGNVTPNKLIVIHNSPPQYNSEDVGASTRSIMKIAYFGILPAEGRMIRELLDIVSQNPKYELHIGGFGGIDEEVKRAAEKYKNIVFYGRTPYSDVLKIESECDVLTALYDPSIPNHFYAAPNKFYEALMLGKPVIMAKNTGMSYIIEEYGIGCRIDYSYEGLKIGLATLWENRTQWSGLSRVMKQIYTDHYSWSQMEKRLIKLYQELLE